MVTVKGEANFLNREIGKIGEGAGIKIKSSFLEAANISASVANSGNANLTKTDTQTGGKSAKATFDAETKDSEAELNTTDDGSKLTDEQKAVADLLKEGSGGAFNQGKARLTTLTTAGEKLGDIQQRLAKLAEGGLSSSEKGEFLTIAKEFNEEIDLLKEEGVNLDDLKLDENDADIALEQFSDETISIGEYASGDTQVNPGNVNEAITRVESEKTVQNIKNDGFVIAQVRTNAGNEIEKSQAATPAVGAAGQAGGVQQLLNPGGAGVQNGVLGNILAGNKSNQIGALNKVKGYQTEQLAQIPASLFKTKI